MGEFHTPSGEPYMVSSDKILEPVQKKRFHVQEELGLGFKSFGKGQHLLE